MTQPEIIERPTPTHADIRYGQDSDRQVFDLWLADANEPTPLVILIHGGGWRNGDKTKYGTVAIQPYLDQGISVAAINYRFILEAMAQGVEPPVKACIYDAARAIQTLRANADQWNINPHRVGLTGGSAGACTSLWLAFHKDLADPASKDPVARQSTRVQCAVVHSAQTSLDPKQLLEWMPNSIYAGHAFGFAAQDRSRQEEFVRLVANRDSVLHWIKEYSPIELVTADAPPIYLAYLNQKGEPIPGEPAIDPTHSAVHGIMLAKRLKALGVEHALSYPGHGDTSEDAPIDFMIKHLKASTYAPSK